MLTWIVVASGGAIGCMARHGVNHLVHQHWPFKRFPAATLVVNLLGCCVIGALAGLIASSQLPMRTQWREFVLWGRSVDSPRFRHSDWIRSHKRARCISVEG